MFLKKQILFLTASATPKVVVEDIHHFPKNIQSRLKAIRALVKKCAPSAEEKLSYGMPYFHLNGRLIYFAAFKNHIGFYPMASGIKTFQQQLLKYKFAKGSVQFPHNQPLPKSIISKIVKFRVKENRGKTMKKSISKKRIDSPSKLNDPRIEELQDWRGKVLTQTQQKRL